MDIKTITTRTPVPKLVSMPYSVSKKADKAMGFGNNGKSACETRYITFNIFDVDHFEQTTMDCNGVEYWTTSLRLSNGLEITLLFSYGKFKELYEQLTGHEVSDHLPDFQVFPEGAQK